MRKPGHVTTSVGIELDNVGSTRSREEGAAFTAALVAALGEQAAHRLATDGAMPFPVADDDEADRIIAALAAIERDHGHAISFSTHRR